MDFARAAAQYKSELLESVVPFWEAHSIDRECGGYFTCLDRRGDLYDTDKFVWLQAREVWTWAMLYDEVEPRPKWLELARGGARFLERHGRDEAGRWYFALTREGAPLVQPYNIFSDCFAAMAFARLAKTTGSAGHGALARGTFESILRRSGDPKGPYNKAVPGTRPLKNFSLPMILCNLTLELEPVLPADLVERTIAAVLSDVLEVFYDPRSGWILENVGADGRPVDCFEGRLLNPGHAVEAMGFVLDLAERRRDPALACRAAEIMLGIVERSWDAAHGGLFYFLDRLGRPPQQLEWDQKLWWVHVEALVGLIKGYAIAGEARCLDWFEKVHDYAWARFPDREFGEWFGYLNRAGEVLLPLKGGKWKGFFHIPRGLRQVWKTMERLHARS